MVDMTGKLWDDTSKGKRSLVECIQAAQASHRRGMGCDATVCYINPGAHPDAPAVVEGVEIRRDRHVSPNYYWIGVNGVEPETEPVDDPEPTPTETVVGYYRTCPDDDCKAEQFIVNTRCWNCGHDLTVKEPA